MTFLSGLVIGVMLGAIVATMVLLGLIELAARRKQGER